MKLHASRAILTLAAASLIATASLSLASCPAPSGVAKLGWAKQDLERDGLSGKIKYMKLEVSKVTYVDGALKEFDGYLREERLYTEDGWLKESTNYSEDGKVSMKFTASFDASGRKTGETVTGADGKELGRVAYAFDAAGQRSSIETYKEGVLIQKTEYLRDADKATVTISRFAEGKVAGRTLKSYDKAGRLMNDKEYVDGELSREIAYEYDERDLVKTEISYAGDGTPSAKKEYSYSAEGKPLEVRGFFPFTILSSRMAYTYSKDDMSSMDYFNEAGILASRLEFSEDEKGNRVLSITYRVSPDGTEMVPSDLLRISYIYW